MSGSERRRRPRRAAMVLVAGALVAGGACSSSGGAPAVSKLAEACAATSNLGRPHCDCVAEKAAAELSPGAFTFLTASLEGDSARTTELRASLDVADVMAAGMFMTTAPAACAREAAPE